MAGLLKNGRTKRCAHSFYARGKTVGRYYRSLGLLMRPAIAEAAVTAGLAR